MKVNSEQSFMDGILHYESETQLVRAKGEHLTFTDYTHLKIYNENYIVSPSAYHSINNQMQINGNGFTELSDFTKASLYNEILSNERLQNKSFLIIIVSGQVKAMMVDSKDKRSFSYIETSEVISVIKKEFDKIGIPLLFEDGIFDDYYAVATYRLRKPYYPGYSFYFMLVKSNTGYSSLKITPIVERGRLSMQFKKDELTFEHKGDMLEKVIGIAGTVDAAFRRITKRIKEASDEKPENIYAFCLKKGINKRTAKYIYNHFQGETVLELAEFLENIDFSGPHGESKELIIGNLLST